MCKWNPNLRSYLQLVAIVGVTQCVLTGCVQVIQMNLPSTQKLNTSPSAPTNSLPSATAIPSTPSATISPTPSGPSQDVSSTPAPSSPSATTASPSTPDPPATVTKVSLSGNPNTTYFLTASIGGQSGFKVIIDTGSSDMVVGSTLCSNCSGISPLYNINSSSNKDEGVSLLAAKGTGGMYGDGSGWNGETYLDAFTPSGVSSTQMKFAAITGQVYSDPSKPFSPQLYVPGSTTQMPFLSSFNQGLLGMAGSGLLSHPSLSDYVDLFSSAGYASIFSMEMCRSYGNLWIGGVPNSTVTSGSFQYTPIMTPNDYFTVNLTDLQLDGTSLGFKASDFQGHSGNGPVYPIVDSGTSLFLLPQAVYQAIDQKLAQNQAFETLIGNNPSLGGKDFFNVDGEFNTTQNAICVTGSSMDQVDAQLPHLNLVFPSTTSGQSISISLPASRSYLYFVPAADISKYGGTICPGIAITAGGSAVLGDPVFQSQIVVFDRVKSQVGFAPDIGCNNSN